MNTFHCDTFVFTPAVKKYTTIQKHSIFRPAFSAFNTQYTE